MNKYRKKYIEENGMKTFNNYNVNDYTEFLENELEAITVTHCCKSDSEQLKVCKDIPSFAYWLKDNEYTATKNSNILMKHKERYSRTELFRWYRDEYNL